MRTGTKFLSVVGLLIMLLAVSSARAADTITRFEAELLTTPAGVDSTTGFDRLNEVWGVFGTDVLPGSSGGKVVYTSGNNRSLKFIFHGTGVNLIVRQAGNGGTYDWILDEGAQTGSGDTNSATEADQVSVPIASGLANTMHTLEVRATLLTEGTALFVDAFDVINSGPRYLSDDSNFSQVGYSNEWYHGDSTVGGDTEALGGSISYTLTPGQTVTFPFTGKAVAVMSMARFDCLTVDWDIDNGAFTGTFDPNAANTLSFGLWYRWPFMLKNDLSDGPHILKLTISKKGAGSFIFCLDGLEVVSDQPVKRYEAEATHTPRTIDDVAGYDLINGVVGEFGTDVIAGSSNGKVLFTSGVDRNFKFMFYGTGVNLICYRAPNGATFDWVLDEGAQTGTGDTFAYMAMPQSLIPIAYNLPLTLHTLEIKPTPADGMAFFVDAIDVIGDSARTRVEDGDQAKITYSGISAGTDDLSPGAGWTLDYTNDNSAEEASGGTVAYGRQGDSATYQFNGKAVAVTFCARADQQPLEWDIDNGAFTGLIDEAGANALGFGFWHRWPVVLKNNLSDGPHTLKLTVGGAGGVANFDAIDTVGSSTGPVNSAGHWTQFE